MPTVKQHNLHAANTGGRSYARAYPPAMGQDNYTRTFDRSPATGTLPRRAAVRAPVGSGEPERTPSPED